MFNYIKIACVRSSSSNWMMMTMMADKYELLQRVRSGVVHAYG